MKAKTQKLCTCVLAAWSAMLPGECLGAVTELVSVDRVTGNATGSSLVPSTSGDGRYVAFASGSSTLVAGDTNTAVDIFVQDRQTGRTDRVSRSSSGQQANGGSSRPAISSNGRYVAFVSDATNLAPNGRGGIFVHDRQTGATESVGPWSSASAYLGRQALSADGRFLIINAVEDPYAEGPFISVYLWDRLSKVQKRITTGHIGAPLGAATISGDGRYVAYATRGFFEGPGVYVYDRRTRLRERVDLNSNEEPGNLIGSEPSISRDGRSVAFTSPATNLTVSDSNGSTDVFVRDREAGTTGRVSVGPGARQADGNSYDPSISANGRYVAFVSKAGNLASSDQNGVADIFRRDRQTGVTRLLSVNSNGKQGDLASESPAINANGRYIAFASFASNFVDNDFNTTSDIYVHERTWTSLTLSPSWWNFGLLNPTCMQRDHTFTLANTGSAALPVTSIDITGDDQSFSRKSSDCGSTVAPGSSCEITVTFDPYTRGVTWAGLRVLTGSNEVRARLTGDGRVNLLCP